MLSDLQESSNHVAGQVVTESVIPVKDAPVVQHIHQYALQLSFLGS